MGCTSSKLDDLPAVALCRERCACLDDAIQRRYDFAAYHVAYMQSLKVIGGSLQVFFDLDLDGSAGSPVLPLPSQKKGDHEVQKEIKLKAEPSASSGAAALNDRSNSNSGSHLHFHSDSDDEDGSFGSLHHSEHFSPLHNHQHHLDYDEETLSSFPGGFMNMNMNFMKNQVTPSVTYQHRPVSPETMHMGEASYISYAYPNQNPSPYPYGYSGANYGYYGQQPQPPYGASSPPMATGASSSKPPPSPPRSSPWDFFNPFETYDNFYPQNTPSRDSKDLREEEGIPDLEEDYQHEVVKEIHGDQKYVDGGGGGGGNYVNMMGNESEKVNNMDGLYQRQSVSVDNDRVEYEVHMLEKKIIDSEDKVGDRGNVAAFKAATGTGGPRGVYEVVTEIRVQFDRASESGNELAKMLEVGKQPYHSKNQVSSKMLHVITPPSMAALVSSQPSTSKNGESSAEAGKAGPLELEIDEVTGMKSGNLSSTLQKLHLWEKKLYDEVKAEEKMRIAHERKSRKLKRLDERGAEAHRVDSTRSMIRSLSTKIRIAIQVVEKISLKINKLRDEELWPQLNELIQGLARMWKSMLECHHNQRQAIQEAKNLDIILSHKLSDAHLEATLRLERDLLQWTSMFSGWIIAQKGYVSALNNWLVKCLLVEPEDTADGIAPFSPGRAGAPPAFVICNQWSEAMKGISEKEVVDSMRAFSISILQLWERGRLEMHQRMQVNKDLERKVKNLDREDQKIQKQIQALDKKMVLVAGHGDGRALAGHLVYQSDTSSNNSIHGNLQNVFASMEKFTADSLSAYEELLRRIEEDKLATA